MHRGAPRRMKIGLFSREEMILEAIAGLLFNLASVIIAAVVILTMILPSAVRILKEYERGVMFRLGRLQGVKGPGIILMIPLVDRIVRVDLRTVTMDVPPQEVITRDNVPVKVNAVVYFRIMDPANAVVEVENFVAATSLIAQTTLRSILGQSDLDELLAQREKINALLQKIIDEQTDPWGVKVSIVEVKDVEIPQGMQRAMARQAEAERERRAKVINAEGEFQAAEKLGMAADIIGRKPAALQLRFLQSLVDVAAERNSTIIFPVPIDLLRPFLRAYEEGESKDKG
ncbi:MAG: Modulator of FtsH protease HflK [Actinobacteria bacterium]|nr:Modulator of FtsH protease HflK [Actinomycetota bacterium]